MFKKDRRYVTKGVNAEIDIRLQYIMWEMIDELKVEEKVKLDYLQIFRFEKNSDNSLIIEQSQEVPRYKLKKQIPIESSTKLTKDKVYVIDSGEYSTMLLPEEY